MSAHEILNEIRSLGGRIEARGDRLHLDAPEGTITPALKERLRENKAGILRRLDLEASMRRLVAANISIAVFDDGSMHIVQNHQEANQAAKDGGAVYTPKEMFMYVTLSPAERKLFRDLKAIRQSDRP